MDDHRQIFGMLSALLDYPDQALLDGLAEIRSVLIGHRALPPDTRTSLGGLLAHLATRSLMDLQEDYVETFDRGRASSLYLFEHVHGESRDRGHAMVDLLAMYEAKGLFLGGGELPDYLPVFLEFLAHEAPAQARTLLAEIADISRAIATRLAARGSPYFAAVAALLPLAGAAPLTMPEQAEHEDPAADGAALDRAWEDEPVSFVGAPAPVSVPAQNVQFYDKRPSR